MRRVCLSCKVDLIHTVLLCCICIKKHPTAIEDARQEILEEDKREQEQLKKDKIRQDL